MAFTANTGEYQAGRSDVFTVDPRALVVDWRKNLSRAGQEPTVDDGLRDLARDMVPKGGSDDGSSGQLNPIIVRPLADRRLEVIGGFRRMRAALYLIESGECPDFRIKYIISRLNDSEAALANISENIQREDPRPIQLAHAVRALVEDYGLEMPAIAARLKRSEAWLTSLMDLVMLPSAVQDAVANGTTPVMAALEIGKLPAEDQVAVFRDLAAEGKVTVAKVRERRRQAAQAEVEDNGAPTVKRGRPVKGLGRTLKDMKTFLEDRGGPLAANVLAFLAGEITETALREAWEKADPSIEADAPKPKPRKRRAVS